MELMKLLDLEIAGEFLVMAATLIHIKSKMLLPPEETEEPELEEQDPREELVKRLLEYKKFKDAAGKLQEMHDRHKGVFFREGEGEKGMVMSDDGSQYFEASLFDLITAFRKVLSEIPKETFHKVVRNSFTVSDKIHSIYHMLAKASRLVFSSLFKDSLNKDEVIATFLAVLELMKMREILVIQKDYFSDIEIIRNPEVSKISEE